MQGRVIFLTILGPLGQYPFNVLAFVTVRPESRVSLQRITASNCVCDIACHSCIFRVKLLKQLLCSSRLSILKFLKRPITKSYHVRFHFLGRLFLHFVNVASGLCFPTFATYGQVPSSFTATAGEFISTPIIFPCHSFVGLTIYSTCVTHV